MSLCLGDTAPDFTAVTTDGRSAFTTGSATAGPFSSRTRVTCTTELGYVARLKPEFDKRSLKAIRLSIDPVDTAGVR